MISFTLDFTGNYGTVAVSVTTGSTWNDLNGKTFQLNLPDASTVDVKIVCHDTYVAVAAELRDGWFTDICTDPSRKTEVSPSDTIANGGTYYVTFVPYVECVFPDSNILVSSTGDTVPAKDIKDGQNIVYYNFESKRTEIGIVEMVYIHKNAMDFVKYTFEDGSYIEATDYHPIYTTDGWKSLVRRNGYDIPKIGDNVKTENGWKKLTKIETFKGLEDCYDFKVKGTDGTIVDNYFANGTLVQGSY